MGTFPPTLPMSWVDSRVLAASLDFGGSISSPFPQMGELSQALIKALGKNPDLPLATCCEHREHCYFSLQPGGPVFTGIFRISFYLLFSSFLTPENVLFFQSQLCIIFFSCGILFNTLGVCSLIGVRREE